MHLSVYSCMYRVTAVFSCGTLQPQLTVMSTKKLNVYIYKWRTRPSDTVSETENTVTVCSQPEGNLTEQSSGISRPVSLQEDK